MADSEPNQWPRPAAYALAVAMAGSGLLLRAALPLGPGFGVYPLALAVTILSTWYFGRGPGWVALLISTAGIRYFFLEPRHSFALQPAGLVVGLVLFLGTAALLIEFSIARRSAEQGLAVSEGRFRLLAESIPEVLWIEALGPHRMLYASPSYERIWGRPLAEIYRDPSLWQAAIHPEDRPRIDAIYSDWLAGGGSDRFDAEYRIVRPDSTIRWIHDRGVLIRDVRGGIYGASGIAEDISERKAIEGRLRTSEEHWRQVFENNPTLYFALGPTGTILSVNPFGAQQLGFGVEELVGQDAANLIHPPDRELARERLDACLRQPGESISWDIRKVRKDGSVLWVGETARAVAEPGKPPIVLIASQDITEAKVAAEELRYKTQQLAAIMDNMTSMIQVLDSGGLTVYVNPAAERITGFRANELIGRPPHERLHHSHPDGTFFPAFCSSTPIVHDGVPRGAIVELQDMTERNRAQQAVAQMQAELAHVTRVTTMGELAASIAHGINQPLAAMVTNASACLRWLAATPPRLDEARQAVEAIAKDGTRAGEIINGIRALLRKAPARKDRIDLNEVVTGVVAVAHAEAQRHRVKLEMQLADRLPAVVGDAVQLQQVILNLILNGVEAMGAAADGPRELMVSTEPDAANVLVSVRDSGIGFDEAVKERLFDAFYTTKPAGMGMGLAISRSIIESHRGRIWATRDGPRGAVFRFTLPASPSGR
jgi:PAS domain S-box-containing protein